MKTRLWARTLSIVLALTCLLPMQSALAQVVVDVLENEQDMIIRGAEIHDGLGYPLFAADINGDNLTDIIVAATGSDGPSHSKINCGAVYVMFGSASLPLVTNVATDADLTIYGTERGINGIEGDVAGYALAATDLNGDGLNDLIIASIYGDGPDNSRPDCGEISVVFGRSDFPAVMDLSTDADITIYGADGGDGTYSVSPDDPDKGDLAGYALATGDFNGDNLQDIVIGAVLGDGLDNARPHAGETYIVWGRAEMPAVIDLGTDSAVTTIWGADAGDYSGFSLFVRDLNGDDVDDLMIGAVGADGPSNSRNSSGESYIIYGENPLPSTIDLATDADVVIYGAEEGDQGFNPVNYIGAADVNGDGLPDLVLGAPFADGEGNELFDSGETYVVLGTGEFPSTIDLATDADSVFYGVDEEDQSGFSIGLGDVNGDGLDDIVVCAVNGDGLFDVRTSGGEAYVVYGKTSLPSSLNLMDADLVIYGADVFDYMGVLALCRDVNNDNVSDILVAAPAADGADNTIEDVGEAIVVLGVDGGIGLEAISPKNQEVASCAETFEWTPGRASNIIWVFQLFGAPDYSLPIHMSPFLLEPTYTLPDNLLTNIPTGRPLYWQVLAANPNLTPMRIEQSQLFSFTREGVHLSGPADTTSLSSAPTLEWTHGCVNNTFWVVGLSQDAGFSSFLVISPLLGEPTWSIPNDTWESLPTGVPIYWTTLGFYQPVPWRALLEWSQEIWSFTKE